MDGTGSSSEPDTSVVESPMTILISGLVVIVFGIPALLTAIGIGWVGAAGLGLTFLVLAWSIPTGASARVLRLIVAGFGVTALLGAIYDLLT